MKHLIKSWTWDWRAIGPGLLLGSWAMQAVFNHLQHARHLI